MSDEVKGEQPAKDQASSPLWTFLNSSFGIWLLSTVAVGVGAWAFQQLHDAELQSSQMMERFRRLNFEYAGRLAQYAAWVDHDFTTVDSRGPNGRGFPKGVTVDTVIHSIQVFADRPWQRSTDPAVSGLYIETVLPEFKDSDLLSIVAEMLFINNKTSRPESLNRGLTKVGPPPKGTPIESIRQIAYKSMLSELLEPRILLRFSNVPDYRIFRDEFDNTFMTEDAGKTDFPYTDCLSC